MKAITSSKRGHLKYEEVLEPKIKRGWAKIRVMAAGLCGTDIQKILYDAHSRRALKTKILGHEISGIIADVQSNNKFKKGDRVAVIPIVYTADKEITEAKSLGKDIPGGFSAYTLVPIRNLRKIPGSVSFELASLLDPLSCALHAYHLADSPQSKRVLIVGDGPIALCLLIICKKFNNKVTLIGRNQKNIGIAAGLGAKTIKDYAELNRNKDYFDSIFECVGRSQDESLQTSINFIKPKNKIVVLGVFYREYKNQLILRNLFFKEAMLIGSNCYMSKEFDGALIILNNEKEKFQKIITHILPLNDFMKGINLVKDRKKSQAIKIVFRPNEP